MKKLSTLLVLLLCALGSALAAGPTDPSATEISTKKFTATSLLWTTPENAATWYSEGWCVGGSSSARGTFTGITNKKYTLDPTTNETCEATSCGSLNLKYNNDVKTVYMQVTNVTKIEAYVLNNGTTERTAQMTLKTSASTSGTMFSAVSSAGESVSITASDLDASTTYLLKFDTSKDDMSLYAVRFTAAPAAKDDATLVSLTIDGSPIAGFDSEKTSYDVELPYGTTTPPTVAAIATSDEATTTITQATAVPGTAKVEVTAADGTTTKEYTINFTVSIASTDNNLYQAVFSNGFDGFITDGKIQAYYIEGTEAPTVASLQTKDEKATAKVEGTKVIVTAESGDVAEYEIALTAVTPFSGTSQTFNGTETWIKSGYTYDASKGWRFAKSIEEETNKRISSGSNRIYFFVDACQSITLATASGIGSARNIKVYCNGVALSTPTSAPKYATDGSATITIAGDETAPCMIAIVSNQTSGDGGFGAITVTKPEIAGITLNADGYATYCNKSAVKVEGATAYTAVVDEAASTLTLTAIESGVIPAETGVVLIGEGSGEVTFTATTEGAAIGQNDLKASLSTASYTENVYVLSGSKFVRYTGERLVPNKAYIVMSADFGTGASAAAMRMVFADSSITGISEAEAAPQAAGNAPAYNLNGQRVGSGAKGILIQNGKKFIVK